MHLTLRRWQASHALFTADEEEEDDSGIVCDRICCEEKKSKEMSSTSRFKGHLRRPSLAAGADLPGVPCSEPWSDDKARSAISMNTNATDLERGGERMRSRFAYLNPWLQGGCMLKRSQGHGDPPTRTPLQRMAARWLVGGQCEGLPGEAPGPWR